MCARTRALSCACARACTCVRTGACVCLCLCVSCAEPLLFDGLVLCLFILCPCLRTCLRLHLRLHLHQCLHLHLCDRAYAVYGSRHMMRFSGVRVLCENERCMAWGKRERGLIVHVRVLCVKTVVCFVSTIYKKPTLAFLDAFFLFVSVCLDVV